MKGRGIALQYGLSLRLDSQGKRLKMDSDSVHSLHSRLQGRARAQEECLADS